MNNHRIYVTSWENDGDNYNTKIIDNLESSEAAFLLGLAKLFSDSCNMGGIGNMYDPNKHEKNLVATVVNTYYDKNKDLLAGSEYKDYFDKDEYVFGYYAWTNLLYDLGLRSGEFYTRVCSNVRVDLIPSNIQDVTAHLMNFIRN